MKFSSRSSRPSSTTGRSWISGRFPNHSAQGVVDRKLAAVDGALVERTQHLLRRVQVDEFVGHAGSAAHVVTRGFPVEAAAASLDSANNRSLSSRLGTS